MDTMIFRANTLIFGKIGAIEEVPQRCWKHPGAWHDSDRTAAMRDDLTPEDQQTFCVTCGAALVRREGEAAYMFRKRKTCGGACATAASLRSRPSRKGIPAPWNSKPAVVAVCAYCSQSYKPWNSKQKYCSKSCSNKSTRLPMPNVLCAQCGTAFEPVRGDKARQFCSKRCAYDARFGNVPWNKSDWAEIACQQCGKTFSVPPAQAKRSDRKYCSRSCRALNAIRNRPRGRATWIERAVCDALSELGIAFEDQVIVGRYVVDFLIPSELLVIECFGDFWHCNPAVFPSGPTHDTHRNQPEKDQLRVATLRSLGYRVATLWERDIRDMGALALVAQAIREAV